MAMPLRFALCNIALRKTISILPARNLSASQCLHLKQIIEVQREKETIISGEYVDSQRKPYLVEKLHSDVCPLCSSGLDVKHTDVLILSQFVRSDGCMFPRRITGLCRPQQKKVATLVAMAQKAGLMINLTPDYCKRDPKKRGAWKKFNKYFDESTIKFP